MFADEEIPIGGLTNGDFESPVKTDGATAFEWQIARGDALLIAVSDNAPQSGRYALIMGFGKLNTSFRPISQLVVVEPGRMYTVTFQYRSEIEALRSELKWAVTEPVSGRRLGDSGALTPAGSWTARSFDFMVPLDAEGVRLESVRENCSGPACTVSGNIWFDDFAMTAR